MRVWKRYWGDEYSKNLYCIYTILVFLTSRMLNSDFLFKLTLVGDSFNNNFAYDPNLILCRSSLFVKLFLRFGVKGSLINLIRSSFDISADLRVLASKYSNLIFLLRFINGSVPQGVSLEILLCITYLASTKLKLSNLLLWKTYYKILIFIFRE